MSPVHLKGWFVCQANGESSLHYFIYADTEYEARKSLGVLSVGRELTQMTWARVSELTGCVIPPQQNPEHPACGGLMFRYRGNLVLLWREVGD